jgi:hypothetical protein
METKEIELLLNQIEEKLAAHKEFKAAYNKELAFDFSIFSFFATGENKYSEILAFFLDPLKPHGQGDIFLRAFLDSLKLQKVSTTEVSIKCEQVIDSNRRVDILISLKDFVIAIENKVWAMDQSDQLKDYSDYLNRISNGKYLLLYLNPYGKDPAINSIGEEERLKLLDEDRLRIISYANDIDHLLGQWAGLCQAERVRHFLLELKKHLMINFIGNNTLDMSNKLREIIFEKQEAVESLVNEYKALETEAEQKQSKAMDLIRSEKIEVPESLIIEKSQLFNNGNYRMFKVSVTAGSNKIWIQLKKQGIYIYSTHYWQDGTLESIKGQSLGKRINKDEKLHRSYSAEKLKDIFLDQVNIATKLLEEAHDVN